MDINDELNGNLDEGQQGLGGIYTPPGEIKNAISVLILGIISIVGCFTYGIPGLVCGIIALSMHSKVKSVYLTNPNHYANSYKKAKAGYICAIIGTILSTLFILFFVFAIIAGNSRMF